MSTATLTRELARLRAATGQATPEAARTLATLRRDPTLPLVAAGMAPDPWQRSLLCSTSRRILCLTSRQSGKSTVAAALAIRTLLLEAPALALCLSPSLRQSGELYRKALEMYRCLGRPVPARAESASVLELANGSRLVSLPSGEATLRGFSRVRLLLLDEAARTPDALYFAVRPMLATSGGRLVCLSTPYGQRGFFWAAWQDPAGGWTRFRVPAEQCPRIDPAFLEDERRTLGPRWFAQEYRCNFVSTADAVFAPEDIAAAVSPDVQPLFAG
jgi:hypothetical protein